MIFATFEVYRVGNTWNKLPGALFWGSLHPVGAQNETLISNTCLKVHIDEYYIKSMASSDKSK